MARNNFFSRAANWLRKRRKKNNNFTLSSTVKSAPSRPSRVTKEYRPQASASQRRTITSSLPSVSSSAPRKETPKHAVGYVEPKKFTVGTKPKQQATKTTSVADVMKRAHSESKVKNAGIASKALNKAEKQATPKPSDKGLSEREKALKHQIQRANLAITNRVGKGFEKEAKSGIYNIKTTDKEKANVAKSIEKDYNRKAKSTKAKAIAGITKSDTNVKLVTKAVTGKDIDLSKVTKSKAYKRGELAQEMASYALAPTEAVGSGLLRVGAKAALKKAGKTATKKAVEKEMKNLAKNKARTFLRRRAADAIANTPFNAKYAAEHSKNEKTGKVDKKKAAKELAFYSAMDMGIGGGIDAIIGAKAKKAAAKKALENRVSKNLAERNKRANARSISRSQQRKATNKQVEEILDDLGTKWDTKKTAKRRSASNAKELNYGNSVQKYYRDIDNRAAKGKITKREAKKEKKALARVVERESGKRGIVTNGKDGTKYYRATKKGLEDLSNETYAEKINFGKRFNGKANSIGMKRVRERMAQQPKMKDASIKTNASRENIDRLVNQPTFKKVSKNLRGRTTRAEAKAEKAYEKIRTISEGRKQALAQAKEAEGAKAFSDKYTVGSKARKKTNKVSQDRKALGREAKQPEKRFNATTRRTKESKEITYGNSVQKYLNDIDKKVAVGEITKQEARNQRRAVAKTVGDKELRVRGDDGLTKRIKVTTDGAKEVGAVERAKGRIRRLSEKVDETPTKSKKELEARRKELVDELWQKSSNKRTKYESNFDKVRGEQKYKDEVAGINKEIADIDKDLNYYKNHPETEKKTPVVEEKAKVEEKAEKPAEPEAKSETNNPVENESGFAKIEDVFEENERLAKEKAENTEKTFEDSRKYLDDERAQQGANADKGEHRGRSEEALAEDTQTSKDDPYMAYPEEALSREARIHRAGEVKISDEALAKVERNKTAHNNMERAREEYATSQAADVATLEKSGKKWYNADEGVGRNGEKSGVSAGESDIRGTSTEVPEGQTADRTAVERVADAESNGNTAGARGNIRISDAQRAKMTEGGITDTHVQSADHTAFSNAINSEKGSNPHGGYVDGKTVEELRESGAKTFLSDDGKSGIAVTNKGDIEALFKGKDSKYDGVLDNLLITARANGGSKMDCFGIDLVNKYERNGFVPVARVTFDDQYVTDPVLLKNRPDVYVLMKNTDDIDTVIEKNINGEYKLSTQKELDNLPEYEYGEALDYRDNLLKEQERSQKQALADAEQAVADAEKHISKTPKKSGIAKANSAVTDVLRKFVNSLGFSERQAEKYARDTGDWASLGTFRGNANNLRQATQRAGRSFTKEQIDYNGRRVGESAKKILNDIKAKGETHYNNVEAYLYYLNHADRLDSATKTRKKEIDELIRRYQEIANGSGKGKYSTSYAERELKRLSDEMDKLEETGLLALNGEGQNKRLFNDLTAEEARAKAQAILDADPSVAKDADKIVAYFRNDLRSQVQSGLISADTMDYYVKMYPNYVPAHRTRFGVNVVGSTDPTKINLKSFRAEGSDIDILPIEDQMKMSAEYTFTKGAQNDLSKSIAKISGYHPEVLDMYDERDAVNALDLATFYDFNRGKLQFFDDGKLVTLNGVDKNFLKDIKDAHITQTEWESVNAILNKMGTVNRVFKSLITSWSPAFMIKNVFRDVPEGAFQSIDTPKYLANLPKSFRSIALHDDWYRAYLRMGGQHSQLVNSAEEIFKDSNWEKLNPLKKIEALNEFAEQMPRVAEFRAFLEKRGKNAHTATADELRQAAEAAADVTVNFGRSGSIGRIINRSFVPFANPAMQGFTKVIRTIKRDPTVKGYMKLITKGAMLGVAPAAINELVWGNNPNYALINERDRATNYLIPLSANHPLNKLFRLNLIGAVKDGKIIDNGTQDGEVFVKLPKARFLSILGMGYQKAFGKTDIPWAEIASISTNQIGPVGWKNNIFQQAINADLFDKNSRGKTWYGADIESAYEKGSPKNHYDENTSSIAINLGKATGLSPKKIDYLLDSYTGVIGDFAIPATRKASTRGYLAKAFSVDTVSQNNLTTKMYDRIDELTMKKDDGDGSSATDYGLYYLDKQNSAASDIRKRIKGIQNSSRSKQEKAKAIRPLQRELNKTNKTALDTENKFVKAAKKYVDDLKNTDLKEENQRKYGLENAMIATAKDRGEDPWKLVDKAFSQSENRQKVAKYAKKAGINPVDFKEFYNLKEYDLDGNGSPSKAELITYLNGRDDLTNEEKAILFAGTNKLFLKSGNPYGDIGSGNYSSKASGGRSGGRSGWRRRSGRRRSSGRRSSGRKSTSGKAIGSTSTLVNASSMPKTVSVADVMSKGGSTRATASALAKIAKSATSADYAAAANRAITNKSKRKDIYKLSAKRT